MNRLVQIAAAGAWFAFGAAAQEPEAIAKKKAEFEDQVKMVQMKMVGAVKGMTVKGAPYSAEEVNENNQMLADGTRIPVESLKMAEFPRAPLSGLLQITATGSGTFEKDVALRVAPASGRVSYAELDKWIETDRVVPVSRWAPSTAGSGASALKEPPPLGCSRPTRN